MRMKSIHKKKLYCGFNIAFIILVLAGCSEPKETPTKGYLKAYADESLKNVIVAERNRFVSLYKDAVINLEFLPAREGIVKVLNNEAKLFVSSRELNKEEKDYIAKNKLEIKAFKFCYDGIAVIVPVKSIVKEIKISALKDILEGKNTSFKIFMPQKNSGVYEFIKEKLLNGKEPRNVNVTVTEHEVIENTINTRNAIGFVGINTINLNNKIKVLKVGTGEMSPGGEAYYGPYQGYFVNGAYPLTRTAIILLNEIGLGVASGFATFLTSNEGQKIVADNELGPATVPVKLIQLN